MLLRKAGKQTLKRPLRALMVTGMYPTEQKPHACTFIKTQVDSLIAEGVEVEVLHPKFGPLPLRYLSAVIQVFLKTLTGRFDIVNGHYAHWCLAARMQWTTPVVASFLGGDLLGELYTDGCLSKKAHLFMRISRWMCKRADAVARAYVLGYHHPMAFRCRQVPVYQHGIETNWYGVCRKGKAVVRLVPE